MPSLLARCELWVASRLNMVFDITRIAIPLLGLGQNASATVAAEVQARCMCA